ncbi:hypothetical protein OSB04_003257 [Centaurea solstitialis]|uniref:Fe2OG dioxygenase domain-containing protein n=1 Tax=Centaurea solstitialis TaxID=347529 RepID=A0AA38WVM5_9ASTR|nr:hypothetical protein OSB04_003257 [Centaurea solstitialis]
MSSSSSSRSSSASSSSIYHPDYDDDANDLLELNHLAAIAAVNEAVKLIVGDEATSSRQTRRTPKSRNRIVAHEKLVNDYFSDNPVYDDNDFERRFRMKRRLFLKIVEDLEREYEFFRWTHDARGVKGFSPLQKCTSAIRQLAYGTAADATDEYLQMSETTSRECFTNFCEGIIHLYMRRYLRKPTANDVQLLFALHEQQHGLPGMLGSIHCMHWDWKNCPVAWRGQYHRGDHQGPTTVLEAVASYDGWIWHAYYGTPGAVNDIVVVNQSPIFNDLFEGKAPDSSFSVNGRQYKHGYYLADGIYPKWTTFVKAYRYPTEPERIAFTERQESARKDIERAFAMLKSKWHIVKYPARAWTKKKLRYTMYTCIILHNMIHEDEGFANYPFDESWVTTDDIEVDISEEERAQNVNEVKNIKVQNNVRRGVAARPSLKPWKPRRGYGVFQGVYKRKTREAAKSSKRGSKSMATPMTIPTIDLSPFFTLGDEYGRKKVMESIAEASAEYGFFQIVNHGVPIDLMKQAMELSKTYFNYSDEMKRDCNVKLDAPLPVPTGYSRAPDDNEYLVMLAPQSPANILPNNPPHFKETLEHMFKYFVKTAQILESIINECLGLPPDFLKEYNNDRSWDFMAMIKYPPATDTENIGNNGHEDNNVITIVLQEDIGGLEVYKNGDWIPVIPAEGTLVVNVSDVIQVLSNKKYQSVTHRVVRPKGRTRHSCVFFYMLQGEKWVEPLPKFTQEIGEKAKISHSPHSSPAFMVRKHSEIARGKARMLKFYFKLRFQIVLGVAARPRLKP